MYPPPLPHPQVKDITRNIRKAVVATTLAELRLKVSAKFQRARPAIHLDCDGTEIDDEEYFSTLEPNAELIAVFPGEQWRDVSFLMYPVELALLLLPCSFSPVIIMPIYVALLWMLSVCVGWWESCSRIFSTMQIWISCRTWIPTRWQISQDAS